VKRWARTAGESKQPKGKVVEAKLTEGAVGGSLRGVQNGLYSALDFLTQADGALHYRSQGRGSDDPAQAALATKAKSELKAVRQEIEKAGHTVDGFVKKYSSID
jgi:hypothetical protein